MELVDHGVEARLDEAVELLLETQLRLEDERRVLAEGLRVVSAEQPLCSVQLPNAYFSEAPEEPRHGALQQSERLRKLLRHAHHAVKLVDIANRPIKRRSSGLATKVVLAAEVGDDGEDGMAAAFGQLLSDAVAEAPLTPLLAHVSRMLETDEVVHGAEALQRLSDDVDVERR